MLGHGRSVTVLCALLVALGVSERWQDAEILVQSRRPRARLNKVQREAISLWRKKISTLYCQLCRYVIPNNPTQVVSNFSLKNGLNNTTCFCTDVFS